MGKREDRKEENRQKILDAAKEVFLEKGYHSASIADIIRQTDLARGTFYLYFRDKQEIFDSLISDLFFSISANIYNVEIEKASDIHEIVDELKKLLNTLLKSLEEHRELVKIILISSTGQDSEFDKKVGGYNTLMVDVIKLFLQRGIDPK